MAEANPIDELEALAQAGELWAAQVGMHLVDNPDPIVAHAATMIASAVAGIRRAIIRIDKRTEQAEARAERRAAYAAAPKREAYIEELAKNAGRTYDEQLAIVEAARERYRKTDSRPLSEQLAGAPSLNPVKGEPT